MIDPSLLRLIAITDNLRDGVDGLLTRALSVARGGASMVHLRLPDEPPRTLVKVARAMREALPVPVMVHDRVDVAIAARAAGVHLSPVELSPGAVRPHVPNGFIIGVSAATDDDARRVAGADYVGVGPVFGNRPGDAAVLGTTRLAGLVRLCGLPTVAIGGINEATAPAAMSAGACGVAVLSAIFAAGDPERATRAIRSAIGT
jgi:thiamine-phosphate pyrophosphorylase